MASTTAASTNSFLTSQILTRGTNVIIDLLEGDVKKQASDESFENRWIVGTVLRVDSDNNMVDVAVEEVPSTLESVYNDETKQNVCICFFLLKMRWCNVYTGYYSKKFPNFTKDP